MEVEGRKRCAEHKGMKVNGFISKSNIDKKGSSDGFQNHGLTHGVIKQSYAFELHIDNHLAPTCGVILDAGSYFFFRERILALQSCISDVFAVDIHPATKTGKGILFCHATGILVGETAVIGNNVSILHHVTLGGTQKFVGGRRHPMIGDGVLIGAAATILGDVNIGEGAKIAPGSAVLIDVPPRTTVVGNPARLVGLGWKEQPTEHVEVPVSRWIKLLLHPNGRII